MYFLPNLPSVKMDKLKNEILVNEDKLIDENEMLRAKLKQESLDSRLKEETFIAEKEALAQENIKLKRTVEEKEANLTDILKQQEDNFSELNGEKNELEKSFSKITLSYKDLLKANAELEENTRKSENNIIKIKEKMKFHSGRHKEEVRQLEERLMLVQKENCHKSHKINFMLEKIESDCQKWNRIENDLKDEINKLNLLLLESKSQIKVKDEAICKMR